MPQSVFCLPLCCVHRSGSISGSPLSLDYTQKSTRSTLALKLGVAQPVYLWVTATLRIPLNLYLEGS